MHEIKVFNTFEVGNVEPFNIIRRALHAGLRALALPLIAQRLRLLGSRVQGSSMSRIRASYITLMHRLKFRHPLEVFTTFEVKNVEPFSMVADAQREVWVR